LCQIPPCEAQKLDEREYLPANWAGFGFDRDGLLITRSGYKCTPNYLEGMLWLAGCYRFEILQHLIRSDEAKGALRPLLETADMDPEGKLKPTRLQLVEDQERFGGETTEPGARPGLEGTAGNCFDQDTRSRAQTSAAIEPPLQRLRRATARQILITPTAGEDQLAGASPPSPAVGAFQRI
jgi:hypothetical protein